MHTPSLESLTPMVMCSLSHLLAKELAALAAESQALKEILASSDSEGFAKRVFDKVYHTDIQRLRSMEDMWKTRKAPTPLKYDGVINQVDDLTTTMDTTPVEGSTLKDQRVWTLQETAQTFTDRYVLFWPMVRVPTLKGQSKEG